MVACALFRSGFSFHYPSTVLKHWKPRPAYVAPSPINDNEEENDEKLVLNPDELKNIKQRILLSLKKLGRNPFFGKKRKSNFSSISFLARKFKQLKNSNQNENVARFARNVE